MRILFKHGSEDKERCLEAVKTYEETQWHKFDDFYKRRLLEIPFKWKAIELLEKLFKECEKSPKLGFKGVQKYVFEIPNIQKENNGDQKIESGVIDRTNQTKTHTLTLNIDNKNNSIFIFLEQDATKNLICLDYDIGSDKHIVKRNFDQKI